MPSPLKRKLVIVGDHGCGKTSLLTVFSTGTFPTYTPYILETYTTSTSTSTSTSIHVYTLLDPETQTQTQTQIDLELTSWDTPSQEDIAATHLRSLIYRDPSSHVILVCFSIDSPSSLVSVQEKWYPEAIRQCPGVPVILVGCKSDLRDDPRTVEVLQQTNEHPVTLQEGKTIAQNIGAEAYFECSAKSNEGVQALLQSAAKASLRTQKRRTAPNVNCVIL